MKKWIFIRHAEAECNKISSSDIMNTYEFDSELTEKGIWQSNMLIQNFKKEYLPDIIYSSPQKRAYITAEKLKEKYNLPQVVTDARLEEMRLLEPFHTNITGAAWDKYLGLRETYFSSVIFGIESLESQYKRIMDFYLDILEKKEDNILVMTHAYCIDLFLLIILKRSLDKFRDVKFKISNTGVFVIYRDKEGFYLEKLNDISHLNYF